MSDNESVSYHPSPLGLTSRIFHVRHLALSKHFAKFSLEAVYPILLDKINHSPPGSVFQNSIPQEKGGDAMNSE